MSTVRAFIVVSVSGLLMSACAFGPKPILIASGPFSPNAGPYEGPRYYVGRDVLRADVHVVRKRKPKWSLNGNTCVRSAQDSVTIGRPGYDLTIYSVPDQSRAYSLGIVPRGSREQTLKVVVSEEGILTSVNYSVVDKRPEIVLNIAKGLAGIAGAALGVVTLKETLDRPPSDEECYKRADTTAYRRQEAAIEHWRAEVAAAVSARSTTLRSVSRASSQAAMRLLSTKDSLLLIRERHATDRLAAAIAARAAAIATYARSRGVVESSDTLRVSETFDLTEIPSLSQPTSGRPYDKMSTFSRDTRLLITLDKLAPAAPIATLPNPVSTCADACARIFYREPQPRVIRVMWADGAGAPRLLEERHIGLMSSGDSVRYATFKATDLGEGKLALTFGRGGVLTSLEQTSSSALANTANTFANLVSSTRQEFVAGLQGVQTAQASVYAIENSARDARIAELQDQKALLDAQIALAGADASKDLLLQRQAIDAEVALLERQQALATITATQASSAEMATMKVELERLRLELELLKVQLELTKVRSQ